MRPATQSASGGLIDRMIGVATLREPVFRDIEHDTDATPQALVVVLIATIAAAIGGANEGQGGIFAQAIAAIVGWIVFSLAAFYVGSRLFATAQTEVTLGQVLRLVGFAQTPKILSILGFIPVLGWLIGAVAWIWFLVVAVYALKEAFDFQMDRAVMTAVVSLILVFVVTLVIGLILGLIGVTVGALLGLLF